jgi:lipoprotein-anchoring transpeptidase ErfK/SrfK
MAKKILVDISSQSLTAMNGSSAIYAFSCVCGDTKHPTPRGKFRIIRKDFVHRSRAYNAQMNYALQITTDGIFIHESYNYIENPLEQSFFATTVSDTAATAMSRMRSWFPRIADVNLPVGNVNLIGSHGCIRLGHSDAVRLFDWADTHIAVEIR